MKKRLFLFTLIISPILFSISCFREMEKDWEETESIEYRFPPQPPFSESIYDTLAIAFDYAIAISGANELRGIAYDPAWFVYICNDNLDAVVKVPLIKPYHVSVNRRLLKAYDWKGILLIALHEWFHIYMAFTSNNEEAHEIMVAENSEYILWIQRVFNCPYNDAKCLAYVGTENTAPYERLTKEQQKNIEDIAKKYNVLK